MGKGARNRHRRAQSTDQGNTECRDPARWEHWLPEGLLPGDDPHTLALLARLATEHHMRCKLTYLHDPVLGCGAVPVTGIAEDGRLIPDLSGTVDPIPVVMFEPSRSVISQDSRTGTAHDLLTEAFITAGFHRIAPGPIWSGRPAEGWGIYRRTEGLVLRDPDGAVYAEGRTALLWTRPGCRSPPVWVVSWFCRGRAWVSALPQGAPRPPIPSPSVPRRLSVAAGMDCLLGLPCAGIPN